MMEEQSVESLTFLALIFAFSTLFLLKRHLEAMKPFTNLSSPPGSHWLIGHGVTLITPSFFENMNKLFVDHANEHGQIGLYLANMPTIGITHWEDAREIERSEVVRSFPTIFELLLDRFVGSQSFVLIKGPEWKLYRSAIAKSLGPVFCQKARVIARRVTLETIHNQLFTGSGGGCNEKGERVVDVFILFKTMMVDVFGQAGFGMKLPSPARIAEAYDYLTLDLTRRLREPLNPANVLHGMPTSLNRKYQQEKAYLNNLIKDCALQRQAELERQDNDNEGDNKEGAAKLNDPLSRILRAHAQHKKTQPEAADQDKALHEIMTSLLLAGHDATSVVLAYAMYLLAKHPECQRLCREEIQKQQQHGGEDDSDLDPNRLRYCGAVLCEAMRLYTPDPVATRWLQKDHILRGGLVAKKGTSVMVNVFAMHRDPKFWPQPNEFRPDRWVLCGGGQDDNSCWVPRKGEGCNDNDSSASSSSSESTIPAANRNAFHSFSVGPRNCPGEKLGMELGKIVLATMLQNAEVSLVTPREEEVEPRFYGVVQRPNGGVPLKLSPLKRPSQ